MKKETNLTEHILLAFIPFTEENTKLVYRPNKFFYELEQKIGKCNRNSISSTISRAKKKGYLKEVENKNLVLTNKGKIRIFKFKNKDDKKSGMKWDGY